MRSRFSVEVVEDAHKGTVLCVTDQCAGGGFMSVTNDAENVTEWVVSRYGNHRIIYQDTDGRWDELAHSNGAFTHFSPIGEHQQSAAIDRLS